MSGFDPFSGQLVIKFEGTRYNGAEIVMQLDVSVADYLAFTEIEKFTDRLAFLQSHDVIVSWNLESKTGKAFPVNVKPETLPLPLVRLICEKWGEATADPGLPFESPSNASDTSPGA